MKARAPASFWAPLTTAMGYLRDDVQCRWDLNDPYRIAERRGHVGRVDDAGIGFAQLDLRGDLPDVRLLRDEVRQHAFRKIRAKGGILAHLLQCLSGIIAHRDLFVGEDELEVGFGQILQRLNTGRVLGGNDHHQYIAREDLWLTSNGPIFLRPSHSRLVRRGEDIGARALRQLGPQASVSPRN